MREGLIKADKRHVIRRMQTAIQGDVIRALVELITNADDSYIRLEDANKPQGNNHGVIEILYKKDDNFCRIFSVRDYAEGMSVEEAEDNFRWYGKATSGMKTGKKVRGYFGQGAKDSLVAMLDGKICTFKDNLFVECRLFKRDGDARYEIEDSIVASPTRRQKYGIDGNGTIASFKADPNKTGTVPRFETVQEELSNNCLLRKIMTNPRRKITLKDMDGNKTRPLSYPMPIGKEILKDHFTIPYADYEPFPIDISILRAESELTQTGDDRAGGLLLVDDGDVVLGASLFKYDNEPLASRFFGEVRIGGFRSLLQKEEPVLSEERDGLVARHPFCRSLITEIEKRIEGKIKEEKLRKQRGEKSKIDPDEASRYKKAFNILNEIAEDEVKAVINLGRETSGMIAEPPDGFCIYPSSAQITVGKRYNFELRLNTKVLHPKLCIEVTCTNPKIHVLTPKVEVSSEDGEGILRKYITVEGTEPNIDGILRAATSNKLSEAKIFVMPEKEFLLSEGMAFQPESITLHPNQPRKVSLLIYTKMIEGGSIIRIASDNKLVNISQDEITVNEFDAVRHIAKYELEVWGGGPGHNALITAECGSYIALLEVRVRSKKEEGKSRGEGMFSEPDFNDDPDPLQRTSYSTETGKVTIYLNFPSIKHYLGDESQYKKTLPAQVLIADLVAERCFAEIARNKVEQSGAVLGPQSVHDRIQRDAYALSRKHGKKVHQALVDQKLLEDDRSSQYSA